MSYQAHININPNQMARLPFIEGRVIHLFEEADQVCAGILFKLSLENYNKATERLKGKDKYTLKTGDVIYIMPGSKIPHFKLKDHIKKIGAKTTYEIDKATVFIGTDRIEQEDQTRSYTRNPGSLLFNIGLYGYYSQNPDTDIILAGDRLTDAYKNMLPHDDVPILLDLKIAQSNNLDYIDNTEYDYFITPAGCEIIFQSILKSLPIVSENDVMNEISPAVVIDQEVYKNLDLMLNSSDEKDKLTASEIIANSDIRKSIYYLWKLANQHGHKLDRSRFKNIRLFVQKSEWRSLSGMTNGNFIKYLLEQKLLTSEIYNKLIAKAAEDRRPVLISRLFDIVITMTPKKEYLEYAPENLKYTWHSGDKPDDNETEEELIDNTPYVEED